MTLAAHLETFDHSGGVGVRCKDCGATDPHAEKIRHSSRCGINPRGSEYVSLAAVAAPSAAAAVALPTSDLREVRRVVRAGGAGRYETRDLVELVRAGVISMDDAMNSDV